MILPLRPGGEGGQEVIFVFGDRTLDFDRRELRRGAEIVALQPQVFELLTYLLRHRHHVVTKDDLLQAIWGGRAVSNSALTTRINAVRRAIGDDGASQRMVRTYSGKGFRFVADVTELAGSTAPTSTAASGSTLLYREFADEPSIAVRPLSNLSSDRELDYFADGASEEIAAALSCVTRLTIIAYPRTRKRDPAAGTDAAPDIGTQYLLTGAVRKSGHRLRVTVRLIDLETGVQLWADQVDGDVIGHPGPADTSCWQYRRADRADHAGAPIRQGARPSGDRSVGL